MVRQLRDVVRARCRRATEAIARVLERLNQRRPRLAVERLQDAGLIEDDRLEGGGVELLQPFVVRDDDLMPDHVGLLARIDHVDPELGRLADRLLSHTERRENQRRHIERMCPSDLHERLPQPAVSKDSRPTLPERPAHQLRLPLIQIRRQSRHPTDPGADVHAALAGEKLGVAHEILSKMVATRIR